MTKMLRLKDVCKRLGVSKSHVRRLIQSAGFPPPVKLGARASAWPAIAVGRWIARQIKESRAASKAASPRSPTQVKKISRVNV